MRILQVNTNFRPGGIQRHVLDLSEFLRGQGHTIVLAGDYGAGKPVAGDDENVHLELNKMVATGGSIFKRLYEILPLAWKLRADLKRLDIQIIHAHETAPVIIAKIAAIGLRIPVVFTYHRSDPGRAASVVRTAKRFADCTLSPSRNSLDYLIDLGLPRKCTRVMGLGVHQLPDISAKAVQEMRESYLGPKGKILVSSLSRLAHQKGIDMMIEVARKIRDQRDDIVIIVGGHGPYEDLVNSWAEVAQVSDTIKFLGPVSDVATVLAASDMYLLTSRWEALPVSIVEAFQSGLPVIATDCGGVTELVNPSVGAILPVGDTNAIAKKVIELADNQEKRERLGKNALELSQEDRFLPDAVHKSYEAFYQEMLAG